MHHLQAYLRNHLRRTLKPGMIALCLLVAMPAAGQADEAAQAEAKKEKAEARQLDEITLPDEPTRADCEAFIQQLREHVKDRNSFSSAHPEVDKLLKVPSEHIDLLLKEMGEQSKLKYYCRYALSKIGPETYKDAVIEKLAERPHNILPIIMHGWYEQAKPAILARLKSADPATAQTKAGWFQAYVEVAEPEHYPKLHQLALRAEDVGQLIPLLQTLPDYDLNNTINAAWRKLTKQIENTRNTWQLRRQRQVLAPHAAAIGNVDALGVLIEEIDDTPSHRIDLDQINTERLNAMRYIDFRGSNKQIKQWYADHRDKLVFDRFRKKFTLPEEF